MIPKKVVIVTTGGWGDVKPEDYREYIDVMKRWIAEANEDHKKLMRTALDKYQVEEAETPNDALGRFDGSGGMLIFVSRRWENHAEQIAEKDRRIRVFLFTGLIPEGRVRYIQKGWVLGHEQIDDVLSS